MGMFDHIKFEANCINCGEKLTDFQSKDGPCILENLSPAQLVVLAGGRANFYDYCDNCKFMNEYWANPIGRLPAIPEAEIDIVVAKWVLREP